MSDTFTLRELDEALSDAIPMQEYIPEALRRTVQRARDLVRANYEVQFDPSGTLSERNQFPHSESERNGMEDARFVRFVEDDGTVTYYGTYTAYDGRTISPQLIETKDFCRFQVHTLGGSAIQNKGMALFPRRVDGRYAMLSPPLRMTFRARRELSVSAHLRRLIRFVFRNQPKSSGRGRAFSVRSIGGG